MSGRTTADESAGEGASPAIEGVRSGATGLLERDRELATLETLVDATVAGAAHVGLIEGSSAGRIATSLRSERSSTPPRERNRQLKRAES